MSVFFCEYHQKYEDADYVGYRTVDDDENLDDGALHISYREFCDEGYSLTVGDEEE